MLEAAEHHKYPGKASGLEPGESEREHEKERKERAREQRSERGERS